MSKPDWCTQEVWDRTDEFGASVYGRHERGFVMWPLVDGETIRIELARALLDAHQRGRREGMEEVYPLLERLRSWIEDEVYAELPFTAEEQVAFDAIRAKAQEVKT